MKEIFNSFFSVNISAYFSGTLACQFLKDSMYEMLIQHSKDLMQQCKDDKPKRKHSGFEILVNGSKKFIYDGFAPQVWYVAGELVSDKTLHKRLTTIVICSS